MEIVIKGYDIYYLFLILFGKNIINNMCIGIRGNRKIK